LDSFELVFGIARSLRTNVENALHVLIALYFTIVGTLAVNMVLGLPPLLGQVATLYVLIIAVPSCAASCLFGPTSSQIMKQHVASKRYISMFKSTLYLLKTTSMKILITILSLFAVKVLQISAVTIASNHYDCTQDEQLFQLSTQFLQRYAQVPYNDSIAARNVVSSYKSLQELNCTMNLFIVTTFLSLLASTLSQPTRPEKKGFSN